MGGCTIFFFEGTHGGDSVVRVRVRARARVVIKATRVHEICLMGVSSGCVL